MDYMTRLLIGAAQIVTDDKANEAERARLELSKRARPGAEAGDNVRLVAEMAEWQGRHEAWLEAAQLLDRVCRQADKVGL
jgi:hypothetical protein